MLFKSLRNEAERVEEILNSKITEGENSQHQVVEVEVVMTHTCCSGHLGELCTSEAGSSPYNVRYFHQAPFHPG